ncbi:MAG: helix-turn-helix transcriptional regulator [Nocardioides sp.]
MRASRLLLMLLLLQNRGRLTTRQLAAELEVSRRTILRDVDALGEAGLPIIVRPGRGGGVELGFNYRTRLTGLASDEAEALGVILAQPTPVLGALGLTESAARARTKLVESLPDQVRRSAELAQERFRTELGPGPPADARVPALAEAIRRGVIVRLCAETADERVVHPVGLTWRGQHWDLVDALAPDDPIPTSGWGRVNISRRTWA